MRLNAASGSHRARRPSSWRVSGIFRACRSGPGRAVRPENAKEMPMSTGERTAAADAARLRAAPRCGARTRAGTPCRSPAIHGRSRCRMHGCGGGRERRSGAPRGNRNAWKDGFWSAAARARRREMTAFIRAMERSVAEIAAMARAPDRRPGGASSGAWGCFPFFLPGAPPPPAPVLAPPPAPGVWRGGGRHGTGPAKGLILSPI